MKSLKFWKNWQIEWVVIWLSSLFIFNVGAIAAFQSESFGDKLVYWMAAIGYSSIMPLTIYLSWRYQKHQADEGVITTPK